MLPKVFPFTFTNCTLVSVSSISLNVNHLFSNKDGKIFFANMVDKGHFIGDSLLFTAITWGIIIVLGILILVVITWACTEFLCTENWRENWEMENSIRILSMRTGGVQNIEATQGKF